MKRYGILIVLAFAVGLHGQNDPTPAPKPISLGQVRSIYVAPIGDQLSGFIVQRLLKWKDIRVSNSPEDADVLLIGTGEIREPMRADGLYTGTKIHSAEVSLIDARTKAPIWSAAKGTHGLLTTLTAGEMGTAHSQPKLADQIVGQLRHDWQKAQLKKVP